MALLLRVLLSEKLARKYHPDTNPDKSAQEKFVEIQDAYDVRVLVDKLLTLPLGCSL
jgi:hypothetical protein